MDKFPVNQTIPHSGLEDARNNIKSNITTDIAHNSQKPRWRTNPSIFSPVFTDIRRQLPRLVETRPLIQLIFADYYPYLSIAILSGLREYYTAIADTHIYVVILIYTRWYSSTLADTCKQLSLHETTSRRVHAQCPTACFCTSDVIDCSNLNLNELPVGTTPSSFDRLSRLDYSNNGISVLDIDRLFQFIRGLEVDVIDFSSNRISDVIGTFDANDGKDYLVLNLSRNVLQTFPSSIIPLNHIRGMITIDISHNQLTELTRNMFAGGNDVILPRFQFFATNNLISRVDPETFQGVSILDAIVDLRSNLIRTLTEDFQSPRSVRQLRFSDNPWHCDCNLRWIITPANRLVNHTMDDPPACRTPAAVQGRRIFELRPDDFACLPFQDGPLRQNYLNMDSFLVRCPVNADPPRFQVDCRFGYRLHSVGSYPTLLHVRDGRTKGPGSQPQSSLQMHSKK
ncbi:putative protein slit [Apostichopus japonicus]|uniref:Uncharacterized protein n=1 Tax=Stichopus japonicus TaxID=307972 RepID=A0A2G8JCG3_STIJA|nr:putative protein slit [Apostichopus japonicus]